MGNETSQDFPSDDDHDPMVSHPSMPPRSTTPLSEVASMCSRRLSSASLGQFDDPPEVDLSHLSREERAKIAAVMARARQAQDEEADRIRELEEDFQAACFSRDDSERDYDTTDLCPVCDTTELTGDNVNVCSNCEAFVCPNCGAYDINSTTKEWVCLLCQKQRQTQQCLRDTGQPQATVTEGRATGSTNALKSTAECPTTGQPGFRKQETPYNTQHKQQQSDTQIADVETLRTRSGVEAAREHKTYIDDTVQSGFPKRDNPFSKPQDAHTMDPRDAMPTAIQSQHLKREEEARALQTCSHKPAEPELFKQDTSVSRQHCVQNADIPNARQPERETWDPRREESEKEHNTSIHETKEPDGQDTMHKRQLDQHKSDIRNAKKPDAETPYTRSKSQTTEHKTYIHEDAGSELHKQDAPRDRQRDFHKADSRKTGSENRLTRSSSSQEQETYIQQETPFSRQYDVQEPDTRQTGQPVADIRKTRSSSQDKTYVHETDESDLRQQDTPHGTHHYAQKADDNLRRQRKEDTPLTHSGSQEHKKYSSETDESDLHKHDTPRNRQHDAQKADGRITGQPEEETTHGRIGFQVMGHTYYIQEPAELDSRQSDIQCNIQRDPQKADDRKAKQPEVETPPTRSGGKGKFVPSYARASAEPGLQIADKNYVDQGIVPDECFEDELAKHRTDDRFAAKRDPLKSDIRDISNKRDYSVDFNYEPTPEASYTTHADADAGDQVVMPLRAMSRTTSLQDGLSEAADSTTACAAIKRSFEAPCTDDYVDYDDLSDSSDDSNYARLDGNTTTRRDDHCLSGGQSMESKVMLATNADAVNSEASRADESHREWNRRDTNIRDADIIDTEVANPQLSASPIDKGRDKTARPRQLVLGQLSVERSTDVPQNVDRSGRSEQSGKRQQDGKKESMSGANLAQQISSTYQQQMTCAASHIIDCRDVQRLSATQALDRPAMATAVHETGDGQDRHDESRKKPSALEKVSVGDAADSDKRTSPSRRSPRSPPRSPSWMRYRDGSSRSSPNRTLSPPMSPSTRYQSSLPDSTLASCGDPYDGDYFTYAGNYVHEQSLGDAAVTDRVQPMPARKLNDQRSSCDDMLEMESLDLATFAAAVANDTAHLTNLSASPTNQDVIPTPPEIASNGSCAADILPEPKPKVIDHQGNKRQKAKPPPTDWSPVTDLSPILDVSPSIEAIEQADMFAQHDAQTRVENRKILSAQDPTQSLKRYEHFDDISMIGNGAARSSDHTEATGDTIVDDICVTNIKSAKEISNERGSVRVAIQGNQHPQTVVPHVAITNVARPTPGLTPIPSTQMSRKATDPTTVPPTHASYRPPDSTPTPPTQHSMRSIDSSSGPLTHTTRRTPEPRPLPPTQILHQSPDSTPVTETTTSNVTPVQLTQLSRQTADATETPRRTSETKPVTLTKTARRTPEYVTHTSRRIPITQTQAASPQEDSKAQSNSRLAEDKKIRRKLPSLPAEDTTPSKPDRHSPQTPDKELLRQTLRLRQVENQHNQKSANVKAKTKPDLAPRVRATSADRSPKSRQLSETITQPSITTHVSVTAKQVYAPITSRMQTPQITAHHPTPPVCAAPITPTTKNVDRAPNSMVHTPTNVALASVNATRPSSFVDQPPLSVTRPRVPVKPRQEEMTTVHGIRVPVNVKFLKQRLKEEIQIVTASRRLRIDEQDEIRRMETLLALREKQRVAAEADAERERQRRSSCRSDNTTLVTQPKERDGNVTGSGTSNQNGSTPSQQRVISPHALPRRLKHKRQNLISDPVVTKFSPIEEDRDVEHELGAKMRSDVNAKRRPEVRHVDTTTHIVPTCRSSTALAQQAMQPVPSSKLLTPLSRSSEVLHEYSVAERDARLMNSQSESCLPITTPPRCRTPTFEERRKKERRKTELQQEIYKRKRKLEEAMLMAEDVNNVEMEVQDICFQHVRATDKSVAGIIRPIDDGPPPEQLYYYNDLLFSDPTDEELSYSSTEYLAHRYERQPRSRHEHAYIPVEFLSDTEYDIQCRSQNDNEILLTHVGSAPSSLGYAMAGHHSDTSARSAATMYRPCDIIADRFPVSDRLADCEFAANLTDASTTPGSEVGPSAMPLLADVQHRSRALVRNIGSRPLSDDLEKYYCAKDPLNTMFRADSERSLCDSDENVMEGGVTIKQRVEQRQPVSSTNRNRTKYDCQTKRILLTRDPKDRVVKGNTMGMRIVGGKFIPNGGGEVGAFVAAIFPGGVAEQLHGELREGDQVLEWNGIPLTGKTFEDVQQIIAQPNGELELVVRPGAEMTDRKQHSNTMSTLCSDSCHSSYDNIESVSDENDYGHLADTGADHTKLSPGASVTSSQPDLDITPSLSTSASSEQTDPTSTDSPSDAAAKLHSTTRDVIVAQQQKQADPVPDQDINLGDIQLQLSHDGYDGTLNVHVIQARNLEPKDKNGFSDPYVKVYLLPGRSSEKKRRTKYIARSLDPEWHQTLVFMNIPRTQLVSKTLEITVWDYDRFKPNEFLGAVLIDLSEKHYMDNKPHWYKLRPHPEVGELESRSPPPGAATPGHKSPSHKRDSKEKSPKNRNRAKRESSPAVEPTSTKFSLGLGRRKGQSVSDAERRKT